MKIRLRDGSETTDPRLDRIPHYDDKSREWQQRTALEQMTAAEKRRRRSHRPSRLTLDQLKHGACCLASFATGRNDSPSKHRPVLTFADFALPNYFEVQKEDPWPGGAYEGAVPQYEGTSVLSTMIYAKRMGWISHFRWVGAGSQRVGDDIWETLSYDRGIELGIPWYGSMWRPSPSGLLEVDPSSGLDGYHAIWALAARYMKLPGHGTKKHEVAALHQTWGPEWGVEFYGVGGFCWVKLEDLEAHLMPNNGEGAVPYFA